ncbi:MAG TPA: hypothetical protein VNJ46_01060 [Gaiellaceae bacterium]|nr:hypothetical protein [Gaiellaceae bacterium]
MKKTMVALLALASVCAATPAASQRPHARGSPDSPSLLRLPRATRAGEQALWGHIRSLTRAGGRWRLRFDPGLLLFGTAAEQAQYEDTGLHGPVANDSYEVEESHRAYTYTVSPRAVATVLARSLAPLRVGLPELAQILRGANPRRRPLFGDPRRASYWITVGAAYPNPVLTIDEQYRP